MAGNEVNRGSVSAVPGGEAVTRGGRDGGCTVTADACAAGHACGGCCDVTGGRDGGCGSRVLDAAGRIQSCPSAPLWQPAGDGAVPCPTTPIWVHPGQLSGEALVPPSKSVAHRAMICAALSGDPAWWTALHGLNGLLSDDLEATRRILEQITGTPPDVPLDLHCAESGSTLRFMIPVLAALGRTARVDGGGGLPRRPLRAFVEMFDGHGVQLAFPPSDVNLPVQVSGRMDAGVYRVDGSKTSQYLSGLLMALPMAGGGTVVLTAPLESVPYVDVTCRVMAAFGVTVEVRPDLGDHGGFVVAGGQRYVIPDGGYTVEADYSQAAFWLTAQAVGHPVAVSDLPADSVQGDRAVVAALAALKAAAAGETAGAVIDLSDTPDLAPPLFLAAAATPGIHVLTGCRRLRYKESDRLTAGVAVLRQLGVAVEADEDQVRIRGAAQLPFDAARIGAVPASCVHDHRMVMTLAIAATVSRRGLYLDDPQAVEKSWPTFFKQFYDLGGRWTVCAPPQTATGG